MPSAPAYQTSVEARVPAAKGAKLFKRPRLAALAFGLIVAALLLGIAEGALRLAGFGGYAPTFRPAGRLDDGSTLYLTDPAGPGSYFFANRSGGMAPDPAALVMPKPRGTVRIMFAGESAAKGIPQPRPLRAAALLQAMLGEAWPDRAVEVINLGTPAIASYPVLGVLTESLDYDPDLVVVYVGNNEFYGAYGVSSLHSAGRAPALIRARRALHSTALAQGLTRLAGGRAPRRAATLMEAMVGQSSIGPDDPARAAAARTLRAFVGDMIDRCSRRGVPVIVCTPPCNERDFAPVGEPDLSDLPEHQRERLAELLGLARALIERDPHEAASAARGALEIRPDHAPAHFLLGRALLAQGREGEARASFRRAIDLDPMPWRPPALSIAAIRAAVAERGAVLADLEAAFRAESPGGAVGWELMDDHVHPSLRGQDLVARTIVRAMADLPGPLRVDPGAAAALPDWRALADRQGASPAEAYGVATRMELLGRISIFERSNPELLARSLAARRRIEAESPPLVAEALAEWARGAGDRTDRYPASAAVGYALHGAGRPAEAEPYFRFAAASADPYGSWSLEFAYHALLCRAQASGGVSPEDRRLALETIRAGRVLIDSGRSASGGAELWVGLLFQLRNEAGESLPYLLAARSKLTGANRVAADEALVRSYAALGRAGEARAIIEEGLRGPFAEAYRAMRPR